MQLDDAHKYEELRYVVECTDRDPRRARCFEPIAAFNCEPVAIRYAAECRKTNPRNEYRVIGRTLALGFVAVDPKTVGDAA